MEYTDFFHMFGVYLHGTSRDYPNVCPLDGVYIMKRLPQTLRASGCNEQQALYKPHIFLISDRKFSKAGKERLNFQGGYDEMPQEVTIDGSDADRFVVGKLNLLNGEVTLSDAGMPYTAAFGGLIKELREMFRAFSCRHQEMELSFVTPYLSTETDRIERVQTACSSWIGNWHASHQ